jgi:LPS-assembly protein
VTRLLGATLAACLLAAAAFTPVSALAQDAEALGLSERASSNADMLLEADTLTYDNDNNTVTAEGGVQIDYDGNKLVADRVTYHRGTGRLVASGNVQVVDPLGTVIYSDEIDITDDFADGFVNAMRAESLDETGQKTYFAAESAERKAGSLTTFNNGVYTACEPCEEKPDKAPIWRVKSRKIVWDGKKKTIRFYNSRFELFGLPIAYMPVWQTADPTVKRKTGFLMPRYHYSSELGFGAIVPFYLALSPTYDMTLAARHYGRQGFLGQAEWRQRFNNGQYYIRVAGIRQKEPDAFGWGSEDAGLETDPNRLRTMVGTKGRFAINPRWTFGWDLLWQSDKDFSRTYQIEGFKELVHRSEIYLTGLSGRNYFDLRGMAFDVQEAAMDTSPASRDDVQPLVTPILDYAYTVDSPVAGGELSFDINSQTLTRNEFDQNAAVPVVRGVGGLAGRFTAEAEWKRSLVTDGGLVVTPSLNVRGDTIYTRLDGVTVAGITQMAATRSVVADIRAAYARFMATAGLELRWPVLFSLTSSSHVLEPMAQVFARPDEQFATTLGIPNEDAQSFVFDATTLFERDKFSGYDRMEGGTRVNLGVRYSGVFASGWTMNAIFGQSYHIAGVNSFASPDLVNAGAFSGLETPRSDFVGLVGFATPFGLSASVSGRFYEQTQVMRRFEAKAGLSMSRFSVSGKYAFIQAQPLYGFANDRREVSVAASTRLHEYWRIFASGTYDMEAKVLVSDSYGFSYDDECFTYSMTLTQSRDRTTREKSQQVGFTLSFRTIGDFGSSTAQATAFGEE